MIRRRFPLVCGDCGRHTTHLDPPGWAPNSGAQVGSVLCPVCVAALDESEAESLLR